jgi:hypothetical protein
MGLTVGTECLSEHMTALKKLSYQLVTVSLRLIAEVLGLGLHRRREANLSDSAEKVQDKRDLWRVEGVRASRGVPPIGLRRDDQQRGQGAPQG